MEDEAPQAAPIFKKRPKTTFKRRHSSSSEDDATAAVAGTEQQHLSVAEILRQRRLGRVRRSAMMMGPANGNGETSSVVPVPAGAKEQSEVEGMRSRFVPQTGQVVGLYDRQMNEFVEARMAEYRSQQQQHDPTTIFSTTDPEHASTAVDTEESPSGLRAAKSGGAETVSVTAGKLMEVDLSTRPPKEEPPKREPRVRLGRDGKPWRPRRRNRRNSEDQARDAIVDSILKENAVSRFQDLAAGNPNPTADTSSTAQNEYVDEDTVLERFKKEYQDPDLRGPRRAPAQQKAGQQEEKKGPKMGGSKNMRRAVHEEMRAKK